MVAVYAYWLPHSMPTSAPDEGDISPVLDLDEDHESALLARPSVRLTTDGQTFDGSAEARIDLIPRPGIYLYCTFEQPSLAAPFMRVISRPDSVSRLDADGRQVNGFVVKSNLVDDEQTTLFIKWCPATQPFTAYGDERTEIHRVVFHLFNLRFAGVRRSRQKVGGSTYVIEHIDLAADPWEVRIRSLSTTRRQLELLREKGGYRLTHVGEVRRQDGAPFSGDDAENVLDAIWHFLSLAKGSRCDLCCPCGFDATDGQVWSRWSAPSEWEPNPLTWFDFNDPSALVELFPGFMAKWKVDNWRDALSTAIWWFTNANYSSRGADAGIIFAQTAMERLCFEYCVVARSLVSVKGFNDLDAADKYRLLLSSLRVPTGIPTSVSALTVAARRYPQWTDAPQALTEIRNRLVHSGKPRAQLPEGCYVDAWMLAVWLLEMTLLAICGFRGKHWNRANRTLESVPWA